MTDRSIRDEIIYVRATEEEKTRIYAKAEEANLSASRFLIRLASSDRAPPTREERERLERLLFLFKRTALQLERLSENVSALRLAGAGEHVRQEFAETARLLRDLTQTVRRRL